MLVNLNNGCSVLFVGCFFSGTTKNDSTSCVSACSGEKSDKSDLETAIFCVRCVVRANFYVVSKRTAKWIWISISRIILVLTKAARIEFTFHGLPYCAAAFIQCEKRRKIRCVSVKKKNHPATLTNALFSNTRLQLITRDVDWIMNRMYAIEIGKWLVEA